MKNVNQALNSSLSYSSDFNQSKCSSILGAMQNNALLISEAKVLKILSNNKIKNKQTRGLKNSAQPITLNLAVKRQIGCSQSNCCSTIFKHLFNAQSKISLKLNQTETNRFVQHKIEENQFIQIGVKKSSFLSLVIGFYLLPLISFLIAIFLANLYTSSPILLFLSGLLSTFIAFVGLKKILPINLENHIQLLYPEVKKIGGVEKA